jgi:NAD-dependent SIR2 family protein deacetylase
MHRDGDKSRSYQTGEALLTSDVVKKLAYEFRASGKMRPVVLLGAGASFRSGIPLAEEAVRRIAQSAYARLKLGLAVHDSRIVLSDWLPFLRSQEWFIKEPLRFAENFPFAVEHLLTPHEFRRAFFQELIHSSRGPSDGYKSLARMMVRRLVGTVLTTNFDGLVAEALREQNPKPPVVTEIKTPDDLAAFALTNDFQIVHLHGSVEHYRDQNLQKETKRLNEMLVQRIRPLLNDSPLIVIGYRGAEPSVMRHLLEEGIEESRSYKCGLYWCVRPGEKVRGNVKRLRDKLGSNFSLVEIAGFDELLVALDKELEDVSWYTGPTTTPPPPFSVDHRFDLQPLDGVTLQDLDHDLILSTFSQYCQRLKLPEINRENYLVFLERQGFLHRRQDDLVPSAGCFLLFGIDVQKRFPYACVSFTQNEKNRVVINGNLVTQFRNILDLLSAEEVNPRIRLKSDRVAEEQDAYPARALTELTVNLLVHRDYSAQDYSRIEFTRGRSLLFENAGGLMPSIKKGVHPDDKGKFKPVRGLTEMRNPLLADVFFGVGSMDKEGSGLADVSDLALESGGKAEYGIGTDNKSLRVSLWQPVQEAPGRSRVARPVARTELYVTNLLPFRVLPKSIHILPLRANYVEIEAPLFDSDDLPREAPLFIKHSGCLWSFSNFTDFPSFGDKKGFLEKVEQRSCEDLVKKPDSRILFVWLLNKHWEFFLYNWPLIVEYRRKRAFFRLTEGKDGISITYLSKMNRKTTREVVKKRGEEPHIWFENEAIRYATTEIFGAWALQLRPTYVFTHSDGKTPLSPLAQTRRATRRIKFDRNPAVDNDLVFWARYLSQGQPTISIGNVGVSDLILDSEYLSAEVPKSGSGEAALEATN